MPYSVKVDFRKTIRGVEKMHQKQIPFAVAKSLTDLAKIGQSAVRANLPKKFNIRATAFITRNIRITPAKKRDVNRLKAFSAVRTDPKISQFMNIHEKGGTRTPRSSKKLAVPTKALQLKSYRKSSGGVKKRFQPGTLLKDFKGTRGARGPRKKTRSRKPFIIIGKGNTPLIVRRVSKKKRPLEVLYVFKKSVTIDRTWGFEKTVMGIVNFKAKKTFEKNISAAIRSAR